MTNPAGSVFSPNLFLPVKDPSPTGCPICFQENSRPRIGRRRAAALLRLGLLPHDVRSPPPGPRDSPERETLLPVAAGKNVHPNTRYSIPRTSAGWLAPARFLVRDMFSRCRLHRKRLRTGNSRRPDPRLPKTLLRVTELPHATP